MADPRRKIPTEHMNMRQRPEIKKIARAGALDAGVSLTDFVAAAIAEKCGRDDLVPPTMKQEVMGLRDSA